MNESRIECHKMSGTRIENGIIHGVTIGVEDHGILTMMLDLRMDGTGVGYGGYALDGWNETEKRRVGHRMLADALLRLFQVFEVGEVGKLVGLPCRVETEGLGGGAVRIGHFIKDRWFSWQALADELCPRKEVTR